MSELMMDKIRWKFIAAMDILAFLISLIGGILGGVDFGVLVVRTLIVLVLFTVLSVCINVLIAMMFPEILSFQTSNPDDSTEMGTRVDIMTENDDTLPALMREDYSDAVAVEENDNREDSAITANNGSDPGRMATRSSSIADTLGSEHAPEELAQAIKTVINKDKKG